MVERPGVRVSRRVAVMQTIAQSTGPPVIYCCIGFRLDFLL